MSKTFNLVAEDYTVYLMVGPSNCGKSWLAKQLQLKLATEQSINSVVLSSDEIRRDLIGDSEISKYDPRMLEVSAQAFDLLYSKLKVYISYPVLTPFVFIDSTGLSEDFRQDIINIATNNSYKIVCVLFNYDNRQDWFNYDNGDKFVTNKHVDRMQKHVFKEVKAKDYHKVIRVTSPIEEVQLNYISNKDNLLVEGKDYTVIGDVHSCVEELKLLLSNVFNTPILVGDWIDYKPNVPIEEATKHNKNIIDFLIDNPQILLVKGNHEENLFNNVDKEYKENIHFSSRYLISTSEEYKNKFIELYNRSYTSIRGEGFIVTHAPCRAKFLLRDANKQTNLYYTADNKCSFITEVYNTTYYNSCWPLHLFGHLTFDKPVRTKFCVGLDTGVGYGGVLTGYNVSTSKIIVVPSVLADEHKNLEALSKFISPTEDLTSKLDEDSTKRLNNFIRNKTPYVSGTMCPADKTSLVLEDVTTALSYYKSCGQTKIVIQPKYMGSRAQVLLSADDYKVFTRNGYKLKETPELDKAVIDLENNISDELLSWITSLGSYTSILLDCELMPWSFLGKGLIKKEFIPYLQANRSHIDLFKKFGLFDDLIQEKRHKLNETLASWTYIDTEYELNLFAKELDKYSSVQAPYFVPFNILKVESEDRVLYSNSEFNRFNNLQLLSLLNCPLYEVDVDDIQTVKSIQELYKDIEGIVIKPYINYEHQAPYIKVRNIDYLRLVYGHNYTTKLSKWIDRKHISRKLKLSITEWQIGNSLLDIHSSNHVEENNQYTNNLIKLMFELNKESSLDPRL